MRRAHQANGGTVRPLAGCVVPGVDVERGRCRRQRARWRRHRRGRADRALYQAKAAGKNAVRGDGDVAADTRPVVEGTPVEWADSAQRTQLTYVLVADP